MKKKALATKMAAFVMAGAMTMAMGFPALADTDTQKIKLTKNVSTDGNTYAPNTSFKFVIEPKTVTETNDGKDITGVEGGLKFVEGEGVTLGDSGKTANLQFAPDANVAPSAKYTENVSLKIEKDAFKKNNQYVPGRYHYTIHEVRNAIDSNYIDYDGVGYSEVTHEVIVYAYFDEAGDFKCVLSNTVLTSNTDEDRENAKSDIVFDNTYGDNTDDSQLKDITITKTIAGTLRSADDEFEITVGVNDNSTPGQLYYATWKSTVTENQEHTQIVNGETKKFYVKGTGTITVYGIPAQATVSVEETNSKGYTAHYEFNGGEKTTEKVAGVTLTNRHNTVNIENVKDAITPTGIVTEYAPYILLVAAAGAFAVLFLRRKKEEF